MDLSRTYQRRKLMLLTKLSVAVGLAGVALAANAVTYTPDVYKRQPMDQSVSKANIQVLDRASAILRVLTQHHRCV